MSARARLSVVSAALLAACALVDGTSAPRATDAGDDDAAPSLDGAPESDDGGSSDAASASDVTPGDAAIPDASAERDAPLTPFCTTAGMTKKDLLFCEDFEGAALPGRFDSPAEGGGGSITLTGPGFQSMYAAQSDVPSGANTVEARLYKDGIGITQAKPLVAAYELRLKDAAPPDATLVNVTARDGAGNILGQALVLTGSAGTQLIMQTCSPTFYCPSTVAPVGPIVGGWMHLEVKLETDPMGVKATLTINGKTPTVVVSNAIDYASAASVRFHIGMRADNPGAESIGDCDDAIVFQP